MRMLLTLRDEMQEPLKVSSSLQWEDHNQIVSTTGKMAHTLWLKQPTSSYQAREQWYCSRRLVRSASVGSDWAKRVIMPIDSYISTRCHVRLYSVIDLVRGALQPFLPCRVHCLLFIFPNGLGSDREKKWLWSRFPMVPFQTKGGRFLPWMDWGEVVIFSNNSF